MALNRDFNLVDSPPLFFYRRSARQQIPHFSWLSTTETTAYNETLSRVGETTVTLENQ